MAFKPTIKPWHIKIFEGIIKSNMPRKCQIYKRFVIGILQSGNSVQTNRGRILSQVNEYLFFVMLKH